MAARAGVPTNPELLRGPRRITPKRRLSAGSGPLRRAAVAAALHGGGAPRLGASTHGGAGTGRHLLCHELGCCGPPESATPADVAPRRGGLAVGQIDHRTSSGAGCPPLPIPMPPQPVSARHVSAHSPPLLSGARAWGRQWTRAPRASRAGGYLSGLSEWVDLWLLSVVACKAGDRGSLKRALGVADSWSQQGRREGPCWPAAPDYTVED
ncbi:hypothetical protein HPB47_009837 [Ixodes persulcatus]|uniref:Uncharacterized protein n=1 Tax=Ixodes persulcatus TaxID=34615 RepID=A0AC60P1E5_IXOPE|nr:hypothetical protein HPB47_009837 [Ixodes persulcatus]